MGFHISVLLFAFSWSYFLAHGVEGNGGDVVVCREDDQIISVETLDLFEAREEYELKTNLQNGTLYSEKVSNLLEVMSRRDSLRSALYGKWLESFLKDTQFLENVDLVDIVDHDYLGFPENCSVEQILVQKEPIFPNEKRVLVNLGLWSRLDEVNKAALVLHYFAFREALGYGHLNAIRTRYFVSKLVNRLIFYSTVQKYMEFLYSAQFYYHSFASVWIDLRKSFGNFHANGMLRRAWSQGKTVEVSSRQISCNVSAGGGYNVYFYPKGQLFEINSFNGSFCTFPLQGYTIEQYWGYGITFYKNGMLREIHTDDSTPEIELMTDKGIRKIKGYNKIVFDENEIILADKIEWVDFEKGNNE